MTQLSKEQLYDSIRNDILNLSMKPGSLVSEVDLSQRYGCSRTPIREILIRLSQERLVHIYPQRGTAIALIDMDYVEQMVYMRLLIEKEILKDACGIIGEKDLQELRMLCSFQRAIAENGGSSINFLEQDNMIHKTIFTLCGHQEIWAILEKNSIHYRRFRFLDVLEKKQMLKLVDDHERLLDLLEAQDTHGVEEFIKDHLYCGLIHREELIAQYPEYFYIPKS